MEFIFKCKFKCKNLVQVILLSSQNHGHRHFGLVLLVGWYYCLNHNHGHVPTLFSDDSWCLAAARILIIDWNGLLESGLWQSKFLQCSWLVVFVTLTWGRRWRGSAMLLGNLDPGVLADVTLTYTINLNIVADQIHLFMAIVGSCLRNKS